MRTLWTVEKWNGSAWVSDGTIYAPNENLTLELTSTQSKFQLADGSNSFMIPENVYVKEPVTMQFLGVPYTDTLTTKLQNWIINADYLRITDSLARTMIGRFINIRQVWLLGDDVANDWEVSFERME